MVLPIQSKKSGSKDQSKEGSEDSTEHLVLDNDITLSTVLRLLYPYSGMPI
jgi:hypothetical protein